MAIQISAKKPEAAIRVITANDRLFTKGIGQSRALHLSVLTAVMRCSGVRIPSAALSKGRGSITLTGEHCHRVEGRSQSIHSNGVSCFSHPRHAGRRSLMLRQAFAYLVASIFACAVGCTSIDVKTDYDQSTDFRKFKTFAFAGMTDLNQAGVLSNSLIRKRIETAIGQELTKKGLRSVTLAQNPDLFVHYWMGVKDKQVVEATAPAMGGYGWYGRYGYGGSYGGVTTYEYQEGTLITDLIDEEGPGMACNDEGRTSKLPLQKIRSSSIKPSQRRLKTIRRLRLSNNDNSHSSRIVKKEPSCSGSKEEMESCWCGMRRHELGTNRRFTNYPWPASDCRQERKNPRPSSSFRQ